MNNMPSAKRTKTHKESYRLANTLTYRNLFRKIHNVNLMLGQEINHSQNNNTFMSARYFPVSITAEAALETLHWALHTRAPSYKAARTEQPLSLAVACTITKAFTMPLLHFVQTARRSLHR